MECGGTRSGRSFKWNGPKPVELDLHGKPMDRDWIRRDFHRIGAYSDWSMDGLFVEWWVGAYPGREGRWLCRRLVISPSLQQRWVWSCMLGRMELDRAIQRRVDALTKTTRGQIPQGGLHQWTRSVDEARIIRQPVTSLN